MEYGYLNDIFSKEAPADVAWGSSRLSVIDDVKELDAYTFPRKNRHVLSIVCISGNVWLTADYRRLEVPARSLAVLLPGHLIENFSTSEDFKGYMIMSDLANFANFLPMMSRLLVCSMQFHDNPVVPLDEDDLVNQILFRDLIIRKMGHEQSLLDKIIVSKLCEGVFCETLSVYFRHADIESPAFCRRSESLFYRFVVLLEKHFDTERSVAYYADRLCVSPKHLSSAVKEVSGRTAGDWIDAYVVNEIKRMLTTSELSIQEVAGRLNFANQSFFGKYFKTRTGMSPRQFRERSFSDK